MITRAQLEAVYREDGTTAAGEKLAEHLFVTYNNSGARRWETFDGRAVPQWPDLSLDVRAKWTAAAVEALELLRPWETSRLGDMIHAALEALAHTDHRGPVRITVNGPEWREANTLNPMFRDEKTGRPAVRWYGAGLRRRVEPAYWGQEDLSAPPSTPAVEMVEVVLLFGGKP